MRNTKYMTLPKLFNKAGLKSKIITAAVFTIVITTIVNSGFFYTKIKTTLFENLRERGDTISENLANSAKYAVLTEDTVVLDELIKGAMNSDDVVYITITGNDERILAEKTVLKKPDDRKLLKTAMQTRSGQFDVAKNSYGTQIYCFCHPIIAKKISVAELIGAESENENDVVSDIRGTVSIGLSPQNTIARLNNMLGCIILLTVFIIGGGILSSISFAGLIIKPIGQMAEAASNVAAGDLSQIVSIESQDEIGQFARQFNTMTSALKNRQQQLNESYEQIKHVNQELKDFAYVASHDLKAPLRGIKTLAEWIAADYAYKFDNAGKEHFKLLTNRVDRMHNLIDGILQYSRIGRIYEKPVPINLNMLIADIIDMVAPPENIEIAVENNLPAIIFEETRIRQVFQNLISNAVKYIDKPQGKISIGCADEGKFWKFNVTDNGQGIDEKYHDKIFKIFQTLSSRDNYESTGIGLTLVKKIVELYGGKVWVESKVGIGSTFFFTIFKGPQQVSTKYANMYLDESVADNSKVAKIPVAMTVDTKTQNWSLT
jgi:signal transduction histidine kinase